MTPQEPHFADELADDGGEREGGRKAGRKEGRKEGKDGVRAISEGGRYLGEIIIPYANGHPTFRVVFLLILPCDRPMNIEDHIPCTKFGSTQLYFKFTQQFCKIFIEFIRFTQNFCSIHSSKLSKMDSTATTNLAPLE